MREIEFRAWVKDTKQMGHVIRLTPTLVDIEITDQSQCVVLCYVRRKDIELLQYTGLKDKNGNYIFEGYIVRLKSGQIGRIDFVDASFWVHTKDLESGNPNKYLGCHLPGLECEIIGNIYENSDLLK